MRILAITIAATMAATSAIADVKGSVEIDITENKTTNKYEATSTLGLAFDSGTEGAFAGLNVKSVDGATFALDEYYIGTTLKGVTMSYGEQGGIMPEAVATTGFDALSDPNFAMTESLQLSAMGASVAVGLTDVTTDVSDVANIQASYTANVSVMEVTGAVDYNTTSETYIWAGRAQAGVGTSTVGGTTTYAAEVLAFEADVSAKGFTAYLNGDENDISENAGIKWATDVNGMTLKADANYNFDAAEVTPGINLSFNF